MLVARQWGYWHAIPENEKRARIEAVPKGYDLEFPEIDAGGYLVEALFEAGPTTITGMGEFPLNWSEIDAFARQTGDISEPWEARALRNMSRAYLSEKIKCANPLSIMPVDRQADE